MKFSFKLHFTQTLTLSNRTFSKDGCVFSICLNAVQIFKLFNPMLVTVLFGNQD